MVAIAPISEEQSIESFDLEQEQLLDLRLELMGRPEAGRSCNSGNCRFDSPRQPMLIFTYEITKRVASLLLKR